MKSLYETTKRVFIGALLLSSTAATLAQELPEFPSKLLFEQGVTIDPYGYPGPIEIEQMRLAKNGNSLYLLTFTSLSKINPKSLKIENAYSIPYEHGRGFLTIATDCADDSVVIFRMPNELLLLDAQSLTVKKTYTIVRSNFITRIQPDPRAPIIYALTDRGDLIKVDLKTGNTRAIPTPERQPSDFCLTSDGAIWVTYRNSNKITIFDPGHWKVVSTITPADWKSHSVGLVFAFSASLGAIAEDHKRGRMIVQAISDPEENRELFVLDIKTEKVVGKTPIGTRGGALFEVGVDDTYLFVRDINFPGDNAFSTVVNLDTFKRQYKLTSSLCDFALDGNRNLLYYIRYPEQGKIMLGILQLMKPVQPSETAIKNESGQKLPITEKPTD